MFDELLSYLPFLASTYPRSEEDLIPTLALELGFWLLALLLAGLLLVRTPHFLKRAEAGFDRLANHRRLSVLAVFIAAIAIRLLMLPWVYVPVPLVHDEFSYLLQADTFASGRLTNPTPPLWVHFERMHVNMQPTYQSMYPPASAGLMAFGQKLVGSPWAGVLLGVALMCAAICWMLQGWMPPKWALLGGLFCVLRFATFSYWVNSYWGGAVAALGGALVLGAVPRLKRKARMSDAVLLAVGLGILANSRPAEGLILAIPSMVVLLWWALRRRKQHIWSRVIAPASAVLLLVATFMAYYNWRGTGHALLMPYQLNQAQYHITKPFLWQKPNPIPNYHHAAMRTFICFLELVPYYQARTWEGFKTLTGYRLDHYYQFLMWPWLLLAVPAVWLMMKSRKLRLLPISILCMLGGVLVESWRPQAHYPAPALGAVVAVLLYGLRALRTFRPARKPLGLALSRATVLVLFAGLFVRTALALVDPYPPVEPLNPERVAQFIPQQVQRQRLENALGQVPGKHLVIVRCSTWNWIQPEWVHNKADLVNAKVIWARDMGPEQNEELIQYFKDRQVWFVDPEAQFVRLWPADSEGGLLASVSDKMTWKDSYRGK